MSGASQAQAGPVFGEDCGHPLLEREHAQEAAAYGQRIFEVLQAEGYDGGYTAVKEAVRELGRTSQEVFVPLVHHPGEAQMDFGQALVKMNGVLRKVMFFVMVLPYSDAMFVVAYPRECTETFQDGHVRAFNFFGGVPRRISYDNARTSVSQIIGASSMAGGERACAGGGPGAAGAGGGGEGARVRGDAGWVGEESG